VLVRRLAGWLVGDHLLFRDFRPYAIMFTNVCVVIIVSMVTLLTDYGLDGTMFMTTVGTRVNYARNENIFSYITMATSLYSRIL
jgi:ABC-type polysaccharide transport system permease subunit